VHVWNLAGLRAGNVSAFKDEQSRMTADLFYGSGGDFSPIPCGGLTGIDLNDLKLERRASGVEGESERHKHSMPVQAARGTIGTKKRRGEIPMRLAPSSEL
jgi:hypothetical protein